MWIETERLRLRPFRPADVDDHHRLVYGAAEAMRYIGDGTVKTHEATAKLIAEFIAYGESHPFSIWAVERKDDGTFMGQCGLINLDNTSEVELVYAFGKPFWGQGYATEAAAASLRYGLEHAGLDYLLALAYLDNKASQRVMEKIGMQHQGSTDQYHNLTLVLYRLNRADFTPNNAPFGVHEEADA